MNEFIQKFNKLLQSQTLWLFLTLILASSYVFMQMSQLLGFSYFTGWNLGLLFLSLPTLAFILYRDNFLRPRKVEYWTLWVVAFIVYPGFISYLDIDIKSIQYLDYLHNFDITGQAAFKVLSGLFIFLELVILLNKRLTSEDKTINLRSRLSVPKLAVAVVLIFSLLILSLNKYFQVSIKDMSLSQSIFYGLWALVQLFTIYISYYIYYYIHHRILFTGLLVKKGFIVYLVGLLLVFLLVIPIQNYGISFFPVVAELKVHSLALTPNVFSDLNYATGITVLILSFPLIAIIEWYKKINALTELEQRKTKSELSLLRQQINPHFFFNTLNNLYAMSLTKDEKTPETILQLSELMRYVIYKGKEELVLLSEEVNYLQDYINLHKIRFHQSVGYKFEIDIQNEMCHVPPLLFIILVESAIKHGLEPAQEAGILQMSLAERNDLITFKCMNSVESSRGLKTNGIGLINLKTRLSILYPERHNLSIEETDTSYESTLTIQL